jgi:glutamate-1-semialdehyde 2,1-aminomutase
MRDGFPDRDRLATRHREELEFFARTRPRSAEIAGSARRHLVAGVPMPWMTRWPGGFPVFVDHASGARFVDVDGHEYVDFCMGDTGAMAGHALPAVTAALAERAQRGITTMLPSEDAVWVADELRRRFGLEKWQIAMTATDANRFVLRLARAITGRPKIAVIDWCYHGTVDETLVVLGDDGQTMHRPGALGPSADVQTTTRVVPFNDLDALDAALSHGDVACLLMEPALTNIGIVLPDPGYLDAVREITRRHGVLWVVDETHTICAGPGGCTQAWNLDPDVFVIGKPIGGGMPVAVYGMTAEVAERVEALIGHHSVDVSGIGGTLSGNALALAAVRATLSTTLLEDDFVRMIDLATSWTTGVENAYRARALDWHVQQLGARAEYWFCPPPRNGADAAAASDPELDAYMHLFALNRGILLTPFHNMALMSPAHMAADVDRHTDVFTDTLSSLFD